jgi:hypothetical protein
MKAKVGSFLRKLTVITFLLGTACLILGVLLSAAHLQANAAGNDSLSSELSQQGGLCGDGEPVAVIHNPPYVYTEGLADHVYILTKGPGSTCIFFNHDGTDPEGCYQVSGLAQGHPVSVIEVGLNEECKGIQHVEFYLSHAPAPTKTPVTPSPTCTDTPVPTDTFTPEPPTATNTLIPPTATDTATTFVTILPPDASPTNTATATNTTQPSATSTTLAQTVIPPTLTFTPTNTVRPTVEPSFPSATPRPRTATPTVLPTVLPPSVNTKVPQVIPVTGDDLESQIQATALPQQMFLNFGAGLLGLALVLYGVSNKFKD